MLSFSIRRLFSQSASVTATAATASKTETTQTLFSSSSQLTPKKVVEYLDKFIIGQQEAKKAVAISLRNRWRRKQLTPDFKKEIYPKNILMVGPTGSGKTEIARRLAQLIDAPFIKVEATKYTEIGYHGKDVDQMIQDLTRSAVKNAKSKLGKEVEQAKPQLEDLINNLLVDYFLGSNFKDVAAREKKKQAIKDGFYNERKVTVELPEDFEDRISFLSVAEFIDYMTAFKPQGNPNNLASVMRVREAKEMLTDLFDDKLLNEVNYEKSAIKSVEEEGIVFIDEIDKIAVGDDVVQLSKSPSTDGVQRDLLPIIEGTTVSTKWGDVNTDHILFITSGAFSNTKPTDLIPELLGRLPIRVELSALTQKEFQRILQEPEFNLLRQQQQLLAKEGIKLQFEDEAILEIARVAYEANIGMENIGARRLHSLIEKVVEEISFNAPELQQKDIKIDKKYVVERLKNVMEKTNLSRFLI